MRFRVEKSVKNVINMRKSKVMRFNTSRDHGPLTMGLNRAKLVEFEQFKHLWSTLSWWVVRWK